MPSEKKERYIQIAFLVVLFLFLCAWAFIQPLNASPDEKMRYQVAEYIFKHNELPDGRDPEIRNNVWGTSYGFSPYLSILLSVGCMKIVGLFTTETMKLVIAARMVNVILGTATAWMSMKIAKELFDREERLLFVMLTTYIPGVLFLGSYINNDMLAIFSIACILYYWIKAWKEGWTRGNTIGLAISISICALSYYNAYSFILASVVFFAISSMFFGEKKWDYQSMLKKGIVISVIVLICVGWWFLRNYIIYDGDVLGRTTMNHCQQLYAQKDYKPGNIFTPQKWGMSVWEMLFYVHGDYRHNYIMTVYYSFIGTFGFMNIFMPDLIGRVYLIIFGFGFFGILINWKKVFSTSPRLIGTQDVEGDKGPRRLCLYEKIPLKNSRVLLHFTMIFASAITIGLAVWYSYANDYQSQGRYIMPALFPIMYFVTLGYQFLLDKILKDKKKKAIVYIVISCLMFGAAIYTYFAIFAPSYVS